MMRIKKLSVLFLLLTLLVPAVTVNVCAEEKQGENAELPPWFPEDPKNFDVVYDEFALRVVDEADIFTDDEEFEMECLLMDIRQEFERDLVIYTDTTSYGMERKMVAADFFGFNSYGCGTYREGACLFICMDPENRGFWTACHGPDTMTLYSRYHANLMDDALQARLKAGEYGEGVKEWIGNFRTLYQKGILDAPDWYPDRGKEPERFHDAEAPRVVDSAGLLTEEQCLELEDQAKKISDKYGLDTVIWTYTTDTRNEDEYADAYYRINGYGFGEDYDGIMIALFEYDPDLSLYSPRLYGYGRGDSVYSYEYAWRILDLAIPDSTFQVLKKILSLTDGLLRTGRVPRTLNYWLLVTAAGALGGSVISLIAFFREKLRMAVPKLRKNADAYIVPGSFDMKNLGDTYLYSSYSTRYDPVSSRSSGGSDSDSSYDSGYTADDGDTYSGSGRDF